jgi:hypothetical protein
MRESLFFSYFGVLLGKRGKGTAALRATVYKRGEGGEQFLVKLSHQKVFSPTLFSLCKHGGGGGGMAPGYIVFFPFCESGHQRVRIYREVATADQSNFW